MRKTAALFWTGLILAVSYGCSSSSNSGSTANLPTISADKLGKTCTGFGTSPGDTATFKDSDCGGGYCLVDLTGNDILSYCTADCDVYSCPSGYLCQPNTLGETKHACFIDPNAQTEDAGVCVQPTGKYTSKTTQTGDAVACPPIADGTVTFDPSDAGAQCTQQFSQDACTLTRTCSQTDSNGTITTKDVITVPAGNGTLTDEVTVTLNGSGLDETCTYEVTYTKQ